MSRMNYPDQELYTQVNTMLEDCSQALKNAASKCSFDVPSDFDYKHDLWELQNEIWSLHNDLKDIKNAILSADFRYNNIAKGASERIDAMKTPKIKAYGRMIR